MVDARTQIEDDQGSRPNRTGIISHLYHAHCYERVQYFLAFHRRIAASIATGLRANLTAPQAASATPACWRAQIADQREAEIACNFFLRLIRLASTEGEKLGRSDRLETAAPPSVGGRIRNFGCVPELVAKCPRRESAALVSSGAVSRCDPHRTRAVRAAP